MSIVYLSLIIYRPFFILNIIINQVEFLSISLNNIDIDKINNKQNNITIIKKISNKKNTIAIKFNIRNKKIRKLKKMSILQ